MMKARKKPVVIDFVLFKDDSEEVIEELQGLGLDPVRLDYSEFGKNGLYWLNIETLEGVMKANIGDYIIKGVNGEIYPCKPDIFEKTYDIVES